MAEEKAKPKRRYLYKQDMGPGPTKARSCGKGQKWDTVKNKCVSKGAIAGSKLAQSSTARPSRDMRDRGEKSGKASYDRFMLKYKMGLESKSTRKKLGKYGTRKSKSFK